MTRIYDDRCGVYRYFKTSASTSVRIFYSLIQLLIVEYNGNNNRGGKSFIAKHPVIANLAIIVAVAAIGILIVYYSLALFTKHGRSMTVPGVENMSYTQAVQILHDKGLRVDIRDSVYNDDVRPGFVIEQFPRSGSIVKPGRKIFLYINAVHPKEVVLDDVNHPSEDALRGLSSRAAQAKLEELGFKNVRIVSVLGSDDRVVKVLANGKVVKKMQKIPVNSRITLEVSDGRLAALTDSLRNAEYMNYVSEDGYRSDDDSYSGESDYYDEETRRPEREKPAVAEPDEEPEYEFND